jgi:hypothetical protein
MILSVRKKGFTELHRVTQSYTEDHRVTQRKFVANVIVKYYERLI